MYLLTAVADLVRADASSLGPKSTEYKNAVVGLWNNMVKKKMYLTGGIGSMKQWEGFGIDYHLPQGTDEGGCYAETCAAIGVMMLAERLLQVSTSFRLLRASSNIVSLNSMESTPILWNYAFTMPL